MKAEPVREGDPALGWSNASLVVLGSLSAVSFFNYTDRMAVSVLIEPIKQELLLSDTEAGLITGLAFALFYAIMGVPIARLADRYNKAALLVLCFLLWSGMTILSGLATSFAMLFILRLLVGVGEAGCLPASFAIISERFTVSQRPLAISVFQAGGKLGVALGTAGAGIAGQILGWRMALIGIGAIGVPVALIVGLALRGESRRVPKQVEVQPRASLKSILRYPGFVTMIIAISFSSFANYGFSQWYPAFFVRSYGASLGAAGVWIGTATGLGGVVGTIVGGAAAGRLLRRNPNWDLWLPAATHALAMPLYLASILSPSLQASAGINFVAALISTSGGGVALAAFQRFTFTAHRATANGLMIMISALAGVGLGPVAVGLASDALAPAFGTESLRWAMAFSTFAFLGAGFFFLRAARFVHPASEGLAEDLAAR